MWQQRIWAGYNVAPDGKVSSELLSAQMTAKVADTEAPEKLFCDLVNRLDKLFGDAIGSPLFKEHSDSEKLFSSIHRFRALERDGLFSLAKDIIRLVADRVDVRALHAVAPPPEKVKWGSLKSLEKYLATIVSPEEARDIMGPLFGVYDLRLADAHLSSQDMLSTYAQIGIGSDEIDLDQGRGMIEATAKVLWKIGFVVHRQMKKLK